MRGMVSFTVISTAVNFVLDRFLLGLPLFGSALLSLIVLSFGSLFCACLWKVLAPIRAARATVEFRTVQERVYETADSDLTQDEAKDGER